MDLLYQLPVHWNRSSLACLFGRLPDYAGRFYRPSSQDRFHRNRSIYSKLCFVLDTADLGRCPIFLGLVAHLGTLNYRVCRTLRLRDLRMANCTTANDPTSDFPEPNGAHIVWRLRRGRPARLVLSILPSTLLRSRERIQAYHVGNSAFP
jgi:hypothetical protein